MAIKFNEKTKQYDVQYQRRCPKRGYSIPMRKHGIKTIAEARRVEKELIFLVGQKINEAVSPKLKQVIDEYCVYRGEMGHAPSTIYSYQTSFRKYMKAFLDLPINQISKFEIHQIIQDNFLGNHSYLSYFYKGCRGTFGFAIDKAYLDKDPTPYRKLKKNEKIKNVFSEAQVKEFLFKAKEQNSIWYPIWTLALYTGMRTGELYALSWQNVDLETNLIRVCESWGKKNGFKDTKSGDDRVIQIAPALKPLLAELKLLTGGLGHILPRLSKWDNGEQARELRMFLLGNNMPVIRFHDLRSTWATVLLSKGIAPAKVMAMGGWKDLKTMMIYIRKAGIDTKGALDCLEFSKENGKNAEVIALDIEQRRASSAN